MMILGVERLREGDDTPAGGVDAARIKSRGGCSLRGVAR